MYSAQAMAAVAELAERFGDGVIVATSRGTVEVGGITEQQLPCAIAFSKEHGLRVGGTGLTVRAVSACKGTECMKGGYDVHSLAAEIEEEFLGRPVPKKFKIGVYGCVNSFGKARSQDIGVIPAREKGWFELYLGGMMGKTPMLGCSGGVLLRRNDIVPAIDRLLRIYCEYGREKERFRAMMDRMGEKFWEMAKHELTALDKA